MSHHQDVNRTTAAPTGEFLDADLSLLAFQHRVLALAASEDVPLLERLRFLGIATSNIDEFHMVRMPELRAGAATGQGDDPDVPSPAQARLQTVDEAVLHLMSEQSRIAERCLDALQQIGVSLVRWRDLTATEQSELHAWYLETLQPVLLPQAMTQSLGVPLPYLPHLGLFVAVVFRDAPGARLRVAEHELPSDVARLLPVPGRAGALIAIEEVLRANAPHLHPGVIVEGAWLFRVTRGGALHLDEDRAVDLLEAVATATVQRQYNAAVRVEVEAGMPEHARHTILDTLQRDAAGRDRGITVTDVLAVEGLLDHRCLSSIPLAPAQRESMEYAPLSSRTRFAAVRSLLAELRVRDALLHHPFDAFDDSVVRFFDEAADDPDVVAISTTLYRTGNPSPIAAALIRAATQGKRVFVLVELQARFDEAHNVHWARALERAGGRVVHGLPGLKVHAKAALVERREGTQLRRVAHIGSGNYNTRSGRQYTDLSLFTTDPAITADIAALFEALSGTASGTPAAPAPFSGGAVVAPHQLLPATLEKIEREAAHARAGRAASIRIKANALADREVVRALYRASQCGVHIDLMVRGICTLRPGVPGLSETVRVVSTLGRLLEHSRIYRFENGGSPEYFMGSADLRPRNLRRRVELLVPVTDPAHRAQLDQILDRYLHDATAWELDAEGGYRQRESAGMPGAQEEFIRELQR